MCLSPFSVILWIRSDKCPKLRSAIPMLLVLESRCSLEVLGGVPILHYVAYFTLGYIQLGFLHFVTIARMLYFCLLLLRKKRNVKP